MNQEKGDQLIAFFIPRKSDMRLLTNQSVRKDYLHAARLCNVKLKPVLIGFTRILVTEAPECLPLILRLRRLWINRITTHINHKICTPDTNRSYRSIKFNIFSICFSQYA